MDVIAFDGYNIEHSVHAFKTITAGRNDTHNLPVVCLKNKGSKNDMVYMDERVKAVVYDGTTVTSPQNWNNPKLSDPCYSLHTDSRNYVVYCIQGAGETSNGSQSGSGWRSDVSYTLNTKDKHGICYGLSRTICDCGKGANGGIPIGENIQPTITSYGPAGVCYEK